jgi:hypothetical protein
MGGEIRMDFGVFIVALFNHWGALMTGRHNYRGDKPF